MPNARTLAAWRDVAPAGFTFVLKAPQRITHMARLRDVDEPLRYFCDTARTLGDKLGPVLFQLPPNFSKAADRLGDLLAQLPPGLRAAFEFRHASWFDDETYGLLRTRNAALCVADTDEGTTPTVATADWGYVRLRAVEYGDDALTPGSRRSARSAAAGARRSSSSSTRSRDRAPPWPAGSSTYSSDRRRSASVARNASSTGVRGLARRRMTPISR